MSQNLGESAVPSGFFAQNRASSASSQSGGNRVVVSSTNGPYYQQQQQGYSCSYGHPTMYNPYGSASPHMSSESTSSPMPPSTVARKRTREETFRCEPCDLDLDSAIALESHKKSHVKCNACDFEGAPKVVKGHYQSVHGKFSGSGFKSVTVAIPGCPVQRFRICVGNRPEDVQKWIEERKKRFPRSRPVQPEPKPEPKQGLSSLLEGYSSSDDEKEENDSKPSLEPAPIAEPEKPNIETPQPPKRPCHSFVRHGRCRRGDACPYSHDESLHRPKRKKHKTKGRDLLSSLLESDADRESKLTLQLIHYLVQSDFLEKRA